MEIREVSDIDFYKVLKLHYQLQRLLPNNLSRSASAWLLLNEVNSLHKTHPRVWGIFKGNTLVGFINGFALTKEVYYISNIFVEKPYRRYVKALTTYVEQSISKLGYIAWKADSVLPEGKRLIKKLGGKET